MAISLFACRLEEQPALISVASEAKGNTDMMDWTV